MTRFHPYMFREQAGDTLVLVGEDGRERRVAFSILPFIPWPGAEPRFTVWLRSGAWVTRGADGKLTSLPTPTAADELDALTLFLAGLRRQPQLFDQLPG